MDPPVVSPEILNRHFKSGWKHFGFNIPQTWYEDLITLSTLDPADTPRFLTEDPTFDPASNDNFLIRFASMKGSCFFPICLFLFFRICSLFSFSFFSSSIFFSTSYLFLGNLELVKSLLNDPRVDPSARNNSAIAFACFFQQTQIVKLLLTDPRVDPSVGKNFLLFCSCRLNCEQELLNLLLSDSRVDPSVAFNYPLLYASHKSYTNSVQILLKKEKVNPSQSKNKAFNKAIEKGSFDIFKLFILGVL